MGEDSRRQDALASVYELAQMLYGLRGLAEEVEALLADAMKLAHGEGLSQAIIADAAALTRGRVSQVVRSGDAIQSRTQLRDRTHQVCEWPGDALRPYRLRFSGRMTMPPYQRRRTTSGR